MNRRNFLRTLMGAAGAIVAGPTVLELAAESAPCWEAAFILPKAEVLACLSAEAINNRFLASTGVFTDLYFKHVITPSPWNHR